MITKSISGKIYTDNPFVDELIYYVKQIAPNCIIKNEQRADSCETVESLKAADLYIACCEKRADFNLFDSFPRSILRAAGIPEQMLDNCAKDKSNIPSKYYTAVVNKMMPYYVDNYKDLNDYYRVLSGYPKIGDSDFVYLTPDMFPEDMDVDYNIPIHLQPDSIISILLENKIIERLEQDNPTKDYLKYIGKNISIYEARLAKRFQLLYYPNTESDVINAKWRDVYEVNRDYILRTVYSEAFKQDSDYYDNIIAILIIIQTMVDIIGTVQEHIARRDVFDERCIQAIFASYGVPYYNEIPIKYQVAMMKNLNTLLKFKSTSKCMLDICSIFGFDNVRIFKYFLLRDRKLDINGEYQFNYKKETEYIKGAPITEIKNSIIVTSETESVKVPFPFEHYIEKGNVLMVKIGTTLLAPEEYTLEQDIMFFKHPEIIQNAGSIEFIFYYNKDGEITSPIDTSNYPITIESIAIPITRNNQTTFTIDYPEGFDINEHLINVIIGSLWISSDRYTIDGNTLTLDIDSFIEEQLVVGRSVNILFIYATKFNIHSAKAQYISPIKTSNFLIKAPYNSYLAEGNTIYMTMAGAYIRDDRYGITNDSVMFLDSDDGIGKNRTVEFNFIYGDFETPEIVDYRKDVVATDINQREFTIPFPFENYLDRGYQMYVSVGLTELYDYQYQVLKDKFIFSDSSIYISKGESIHFRFMYPKDFTNDLFETKFVKAKVDKQREFDIPWPYPKYLERNNVLILQINGKIINKSQYEIIGDKLYIYKIADSINLDDELVFCFYYRAYNKYNVVVSQASATRLSKAQKGFAIEFPFVDYLSTNNSFFVTIGSTFIDKSRYEITNGTLYFTDDTIVEVGRDVTFTFVYNTIYKDNTKFMNSDSISNDISKEENLSILIPWPYPDFLSFEGNFMIVILGNHVLEEMDYDIFEDRLYIENFRELINKYGSNIKFEFHYSRLTEETVLVDDDARNYELKFVKVPLVDDIDTYIKNKSNYVDYDQLTIGDPLWDGEYLHEEIKKKILETEFSYTRTKYISIDNIEDMTRNMFDMPYFFNMFFDDVKLEDRLFLEIPYIKLNKNFRLNDTFVFMVVMAFEYNNLDDTIMDSMGKMLYLRGFNFRADIAEIQTYLYNKTANTYNAKNTHLDQFIIPHTAIRSYKQLFKIFTTNIEVRDFVTKAMYNADNKRIYDIFKKIYDSILRLEYTRTFFSVSDGSGNLCETYTEFLKYRDRDLYNKIISVRNIGDENTRKNTILEIMNNVTSSLSEYIDTDEYRYLFAKFPGMDTDAIKHYVRLMIEFFKSYKVELVGINTIYTFSDKFDNMVKPIDELFELTSNFLEDEYIIARDFIKSHVKKTPKDFIQLRERIYKDITYWVERYYGDDDATSRIKDVFYDLLIHLLMKNSVTESIIDEFCDIHTKFKTSTSVNVITTAKNISKLNPEEHIYPLDRIYIRTNS